MVMTFPSEQGFDMHSAKIWKDADGWAGQVAKGKPYQVPVPRGAQQVLSLGKFATRRAAMAAVTAEIWAMMDADEFPVCQCEGVF
jgi:hypothetical protein